MTRLGRTLMLNLFQHPGWRRSYDGKNDRRLRRCSLDPETSSG
jgi:hypothetical protein